MTFETIRLETDARGVAVLTLARPEKRNALSAQMIAELTEAAARLGADPAVRAVILAAEGPAFCAGGDLDWMREQIDADRAGRMRAARTLAQMLRALNDCPRPLIARAHGDAFGGGVGLLCVCDHVIAAPGARFALTETRLGLIPATIGPYVVARIGEGMARRIALSARVLDAAEAARLGLVERVAEDPDAAARAAAAPYLKAAPGAVGRTKALLRALGSPIDDAVLEATIERLADAWETEEARAGIDAFFARKPPPWAE